MTADHPEGVQQVSRADYPVRVLPHGGVDTVVGAIQEYSPNVIINDIPAPIRRDYLDALARLGASTINLVDSLEDLERPAELASVIIATMHGARVELKDYYHGPAYAILRESFAGRAKSVRVQANRLVLSFGGSDPQGLTLKVLAALDGLEKRFPDLEVCVVLGPAFSHEDALRDRLGSLGLRPRLLRHVEHMADVLGDADLVFCSGGMTVLELASLGTPAVVLCQNAREERRMRSFSSHGTLVHLGLGPEVLESLIRDNAERLLVDYQRRLAMSRAGRALVDAQGSRRAAEVVISSTRGPGMEGASS